MIGNSSEKGVSPRVIHHGNEFDFMIVFGEDEPNDKEWKIFVEVVKRNLIISDKLENITTDKRRKDKVRYCCIEKNIEFYE